MKIMKFSLHKLFPLALFDDLNFIHRNQWFDTSEKVSIPHRSKTSTVNDEQRRFKESSLSVNIITKRNSNSHFVTPYRTAECNEELVNGEGSVHPVTPQCRIKTTSDKPRSHVENNKKAEFNLGDKVRSIFLSTILIPIPKKKTKKEICYWYFDNQFIMKYKDV